MSGRLAQAASRAAVRRLFSGICREHLEIVEAGRVHRFGDPGASLRARVTVHDPEAWRQILRGSTGLADSYLAGQWETDDLVDLIRVGARNMRPMDRARDRFRPIVRGAQRLRDIVPHNDLEGSKANIAAHYDLGNTLFSLFLDPSMMYSCAYFEEPGQSLDDAQFAKLERICRALELTPDDHLLEIGTGWGAMACHAASRFGCRVTTTTISREQHAAALDRVRAAGLEERVTVLLEDYRDLRGTYSKLVSIEMIEAVGWQWFDTYFRRCSELLEPDGLMCLQAITIDDRAYAAEKASTSFINTLIFPGGCLPSLEVIHGCLSRETDLSTVWLEDITPHYAETIRRWREGFLHNLGRAAELGYDTTFQRMWELYLAYVEAGFRERRIGDVQMLMAKPDWRGALPASGPRLAAERAVGDLVE